METVCGIYKITSPSGKIYIGSSKNIKKRWQSYSDKNCKGQPKLCKSFKKYGKENHIREIIEFLPNRQSLYTRESEIVNKELIEDKKCMNIMPGGFGGFRYVWTDEMRLVVSERMKNLIRTPEHCEKIGKANTGRHVSQITREKIAKSLIERNKQKNMESIEDKEALHRKNIQEKCSTREGIIKYLKSIDVIDDENNFHRTCQRIVRSDKILCEFIHNHTPYLQDVSIGERLYHIKNNLFSKPNCQQCNHVISNFSKLTYRKFCSRQCSGIVNGALSRTNNVMNIL